ncbi:MAG: ABC transporter transmembrane domain-containing protein [Arenicellales bacterium]|nr:ABC transporter transmembrane domain-containing protein [Arenicellales bacterium]
MPTDPIRDVKLAGPVLKRLLGYGLPYRWIVVVGILGMSMVAIAETGFAALLKPVMDGGFIERDANIIAMTPIFLVGVFALRTVGAFLDQYSIAWVARKMIFDLRNDVFERLIHLPVAYYDKQSSAGLVSKLIFDIEQIALACNQVCRVLIKDTLIVIGLLTWMFYLSWRLTFVFLAVTPLAAIIIRAASRRFRITSEDIQSSVGDIAHVAQEVFQGQRIVKAYGGYDYVRSIFLRANRDNRRQAMRRALVAAASVPLLIFVVGISVTVIIYLSMSGTASVVMSAGTFVSYIGSVLMLMGPVKRLARVNEFIQSGIAASHSAFSVLDEVKEFEGGENDAKHVPGRIEFKDVSFSYDDGDGPVIDKLSFTIEAGQTVAFVGASGSGKSTVTALLMGFYRPQQGEIRVDDIPLESYQLGALRERIALVTQDPILFDDTIRNNVRFGLEMVDTLLDDALEIAHVTPFLSSIEGECDAGVGEQGGRLSGGQRQRVAIARALTRDASILIFDEATAALDNVLEEKVWASVRRVMRGRTALVVAHRLTSVVDADCIYVLDEGAIVETGTHDALIHQGGPYARLYQSQARGKVSAQE